MPSSPKSSIDNSTKNRPAGQTEIGLTVDVTPRISPEGPILLDLNIERSLLVNGNGAAEPGVRKTTCQTSVCVRDGRTTIVRGVIQRTEHGLRETIIAVTARGIPKS